MNLVVFRIKIILGCVSIGLLGGACVFVLDYFLGLNLNPSQRWIAFGVFSIFGLFAGLVSAFTIKSSN